MGHALPPPVREGLPQGARPGVDEEGPPSQRVPDRRRRAGARRRRLPQSTRRTPRARAARSAWRWTLSCATAARRRVCAARRCTSTGRSATAWPSVRGAATRPGPTASLDTFTRRGSAGRPSRADAAANAAPTRSTTTAGSCGASSARIPTSPALAWAWKTQKIESEGKLQFYTPEQVRKLVAEAYSQDGRGDLHARHRGRPAPQRDPRH